MTITKLRVFYLLSFLTVVFSIFFFNTSRQTEITPTQPRSRETAEQVEEKILHALKKGQIAIVSVSAEWAIHASLLDEELRRDSRLAALALDRSIVLLHADISDTNDRLPPSLKASVSDVRLPVVFILGAELRSPLVLEKKNITSDDVMDLLITVLPDGKNGV